MVREQVLMALIPEYAEWESALLAAGLRGGFGLWEPRYDVKIVAPSSEPVVSIGGFRVIPDYSFDNAPDDFAALILVGGMSWFSSSEPKRTLPLIRKALDRKKVLGGICDASMFLGVNGFLNDVEHTSNSLEILKQRAGAVYMGEKRYCQKRQSVRDGNIVTANGAGFIEFARDVLTALDAAPADKIAVFYDVFKSGMFPSAP